MKQFFESIRVVNGRIMNLFWHQERVDRTCEEFGIGPVDLFLHTRIYDFQAKGIVKLRVSYGEEGLTITWSPYNIAPINTIQIVEDNTIEYSFKSEDRTGLQTIIDQKGGADDVIIVKDEHVCDSSYGNVIFYDGKEWVTPTHYLLNGTMRQRLLSRGIIKEVPIQVNDVFNYESLKIINAMRSPDQVKALPINKKSVLF